MIDMVVQQFQGISPAWATFFIAMLPILEVRGAVVLGIEFFHLPIVSVMGLSFFGSVIPAILLPALLEIVERPLRKAVPFVDRLFVWISQHVEHRYTDKYRAMGSLGLILFIAIPLPGTGVWTGALAAWIFSIPKRYAIPAIIMGTGAATLIVTLTTLGGFALFRAVV
ncbi:ligand-binding protein SH3 [Candidatus Uhrbacteria bacterium CG10_big_fil_rev_8_21_14_0_10_50_16]|uniref:Ligand-binding protein SH3 n=1 Tax=Candidatus Uhrbacteria bacterium CG10_big_fil_rev_8_21_14_0_10_50_16 TaxID=1975039 RepID=A0A2H0RM89_9BACT|nr:MAG: ligand-binding protein SH3 [Candidatus Uhrbacteria bacterium CG10_big_fil_rev_8_21_14_0_10_50_16]